MVFHWLSMVFLSFSVDSVGFSWCFEVVSLHFFEVVRSRTRTALSSLDLLEALQSPELLLRRWAAQQAAERPSERFTEALVKLLRDECREVSAYAAWALSGLGEQAVLEHAEEVQETVKACR